MKKTRKKHIRPTALAPFGTWKCIECNEIFNTKRQLYEHKHLFHLNLKKIPWNKGLSKEIDIRVKKYGQTLSTKILNGEIKRIVSNETKKKLSVSLKLAIKEGRAKGWQTRNIESYAEKFWKTVLKNNNIHFSFNYPIKKRLLGIDSNNCYFLDFALLEKKIDLEIDGKQHLLPKRLKSDIKRDKILSENGWKIYRISWNKLKTQLEKLEMKNKIDQFLKWYNAI